MGNEFDFSGIRAVKVLAALQLVDTIKSKFRKKYVSNMFIDLKRTFHTIDSKRLSPKLKRLGLSNDSVKLMESYLQNRSIVTTIGNKTSSFRNINVSVAQGSKMGPLHFIIYINDLLKLGFIGRLILYADDAVLTYPSKTIEEIQEAMQHDADLLHN